MYSKFGNTDLRTSPIVFGCMGSAGAFGNQEEKDSIEALQTAFEVGINFFDTAEGYGNGYSEQLLAKALGNKRKDIIISSKVSVENMRKTDILEACDRSLKNLQTDYLDMYLLHWPIADVAIEERVEALKELKAAGKIRYYGVSNFGPQNLDEILNITDVCTNQVGYHLFHRAVEFEVLPKCIEHNIPIMCYSSLMQGLLAGKYKTLDSFPKNRARTTLFDSRTHSQSRHGGHGAEKEGQEALERLWEITNNSSYSMEELAVGWLKAQQGVGGIIVGTRNAEQSKALKQLLEVQLVPNMVTDLAQSTEKVKMALGGNIDMWDHRAK
jgi:aryl-alcohol dehydrogenase-like predicted oxidoreductase